MATGYGYIKAPQELAERLNLTDMRTSVGNGFVLLSEGDMRMLDLTVIEKVAFFGCEVLTEEQAMLLIEKTKNEEANEASETIFGEGEAVTALAQTESGKEGDGE